MGTEIKPDNAVKLLNTVNYKDGHGHLLSCLWYWLCQFPVAFKCQFANFHSPLIMKNTETVVDAHGPKFFDVKESSSFRQTCELAIS